MNYPLRIIAAGEKNTSIVKEIQKKLAASGYGPIVIDGVFGPQTTRFVKEFQSQHCDKFGNPLVIDGKIGAFTWACLFGTEVENNSASSKLLKKVLEIAKSQIGVKEDPPGSNRGKKVEEFLGSVSLSGGYPWCAAFVYWCFEKACSELKMTNPLVKTGSCMTHWNKTAGNKILTGDAILNPALIEPGFVFIISLGKGKGHTGIVTSVSDGYINTIEGNTNTGHSAEGVGVFELRRKINSIKNAGFIKYS